MEALGRIAAGLGLGGFLGVLVGLSTTPVVGSVIAAVVSVVVSWLSAGLDPAKRDAKLPGAWGGAFGFGALAGVLFGLYARTTDFISPSASAIAADLKSAGLETKDAANIAAAIRYGAETSKVSVDKQRALSALLFSDKVVLDLDELDPKRVDGFSSARVKWEQAGGMYAALVNTLADARDLSDARKLELLTQLHARLSEAEPR